MARALIALGAIAWVTALITVIRNPKTSKISRAMTLVLLVGALVLAALIWFGR